MMIRTFPAELSSRRASLLMLAWISIVLLLKTSPVLAEDPTLHAWIDQQLQPADGLPAEVCSDSDFLRRVFLDLNGMPPRADEARAFLTDSSADKRQRMIDELMARPAFERHLAATLDVMLMERRPNTHVSQDEWLQWLVASVRTNKPWNVLVREMLLADGDDPASRAPARFMLDRGVEPNVAARDIGRMFLGMDLQCAQCHDSPLVSDFAQSDYQGLLAFTSPLYAVVKKHGDKDVTVVSERAGSDLAFESVFARGSPHRTGPRLPGGPWLAEPAFLPGDEYEIPPADKVRSVPKFSRKKLLAGELTEGRNTAFNRNAANRLWSVVFGRGVVHPLDMIHPDNPQAGRDFLDGLAQRLVSSGFDMRWFLRELVLTRAYQAPFDLPSADQIPVQRLAEAMATLDAQIAEAESLARAANESYSSATTEFGTAEAALIPAAAELETARNQYLEGKKKHGDAQTAVNEASNALNLKKSVVDQLTAAATHAAAASSSLTTDQELAVLASQLRQRVEAGTADLPALQKILEEKSAAAAPLAESLKTLQASVETGAAKYSPLRDSLAAADQKLVQSRGTMQRDGAWLATIRYQKTVAEIALRTGTADQNLKQAQANQASLEGSLAELQKQAAADVAELTIAVSQKEAAGVSRANCESAMAESLKRKTDTETALGHLEASSASMQQAVAGLPQNAELTATLTDLTAGVERLRGQVEQCRRDCDTASEALRTASEKMAAMEKMVEAVSLRMSQGQQQTELAQSTLRAERQKSEDLSRTIQSESQQLSSELAARFRLAPLKALTPEQLCWSVFRVTTVYERYSAGERAELEKTTPLTDAQKADPAALAERERQVEQRVFDKLKQYIPTWVQYYGGGPGQPQGDFYASADQALFAANGGQLNGWVAPAGDNASERMTKAAEGKAAAEELYLGILSRFPTDEEIAEVSQTLSSAADRGQAAQELMWGLLNSAEFRFNH